MKGKIIVITGTTASGKTAYSIDFARKLHGEIINCDSMQIYKEIPILSAQPTKNEKVDVPHHLFGFISLSEKFSVGHWLELAMKKITEIQDRGKVPVFVGGTGLYIKALIKGITKTPKISEKTKQEVESINNPYEKLTELDPKYAIRLNQNDSVRIKRALEVYIETGKSLFDLHEQENIHKYRRDDFYLIQIQRPRETVYKNINQRFLDMADMGAIEEVKVAYKKLGDINYPKAHGLSEIIQYLNGNMEYDVMVSKSQQNVRNYAKRQLTFFRHQFTFDEVINL